MPAMRGALIEYGMDLIGPVPNVVLFQFNPESLTRNLRIPPRPGGANAREATQGGEKVLEAISLKASFDAADLLGRDDAIARLFGVGPQICALEKMVYQSAGPSVLGMVLDAISARLGLGGGDTAAAVQPIPREAFPRILFVWGLNRILPVVFESMRISELQYDAALNPIRAEVDLEMTVNAMDPCSTDLVAKGALAITQLSKDVQALSNLARTAVQAVELIGL